MVAGPTTLFAMLNSLQMGFRTLALERRSAEVWQVLGAVKTEFGKFGEVLATLHQAIVDRFGHDRHCAAALQPNERALKSVEALPPEEAAQLLPSARDDR